MYGVQTNNYNNKIRIKNIYINKLFKYSLIEVYNI